MEDSVALNLIQAAVSDAPGQLWYELGAGSGLFTRALAKSIVTGTIIAIDQNARALSTIPASIGQVQVRKVEADFSVQWIAELPAQGVLMANSLHFVRSKLAFLEMVKSSLATDGVLVIVEYEMKKPNTWVPYPIDFDSLVGIASQAGFKEVRKIGVAASSYQKDGMYSAALKRREI